MHSFSGFFYSLVSLLCIAGSWWLFILGKLYNFRFLLISWRLKTPPHFRHTPSKKKKQKQKKEREEIIYMYLHVITWGIRNRTCTWQENIDLVQCTRYDNYRATFVFEMLFQSCMLKFVRWLNNFMVKLFYHCNPIILQNDLIKNTIRVTVVNLFLRICWIFYQQTTKDLPLKCFKDLQFIIIFFLCIYI